MLLCVHIAKSNFQSMAHIGGGILVQYVIENTDSETKLKVRNGQWRDRRSTVGYTRSGPRLIS